MLIENIYNKYIYCPDCKSDLSVISINKEFLGFYCSKCKIVFPEKGNIQIILPKELKNYKLEADIVLNIYNKAIENSILDIAKYCSNTLQILNAVKSNIEWEWEDEEYWDKIYRQETNADRPKNWNIRIWQREAIIPSILKNKNGLANKSILDIGSGEGQNFRFLFKNYADETTLYIAADISYIGLKLDMQRNPHRNSIYVVCSANKPPFRNNSIDIACCFGILEYIKNGIDIISDYKKLLKNKGYLLIDVPTQRISISEGILKSTQINRSPHDYRLDRKVIKNKISINNLFTERKIEMYSIFFGLINRLCKRLLVSSKIFFSTIMMIDIIIINTLGKFILCFSSGQSLYCLKKID